MKKIKIFLLFCIVVLIFCSLIHFMNKKTMENRAEVEFWTVQLSSFSDYMNNLITEFEKNNPNIKIRWIDVPYAEAEKRVLASLLSNNMPDLINITSDFNMTLATKGALYSVPDELSDYNESLLNVVSLDQKIFGVPFYATSAITLYNEELIKEFKINSVPKNYDELFAQLKIVPVLNNKYLFMPTLTENDTLYKILNKYSVNSPDKLVNPESVSIFKNLKMFYDDGKIPKEAITQTHREVLEKYSSAQIAYLQVGANFLNIIKENSIDVYNKTNVAPQFYGDSVAYDFSLMTLAIPKKAQYKNEALLFAKFLTNAQNQLTFSQKTGVLPCNKFALEDDFFKVYDENDLISKARVIGAKQLSRPINYPLQSKKHNEVIVLLNNLVEQILLKNSDINSILNKTSIQWKSLIEN